MKGSREWAEFVRDNCRHEFGDYWPCIPCIAQAIEDAVVHAVAAERAACHMAEIAAAIAGRRAAQDEGKQ